MDSTEKINLLSDKVKELEGYVCRSSFQELQSAFVTILDSIFGLSDTDDGWDLCCLQESRDPHTFTSIRNFLSPMSRFSDTIMNALTFDCGNCKYDFPITLLSKRSQVKLRNSNTVGQVVSTVPLNAFEYFCFAFLSYPVNRKRRKHLNLESFETSVYAIIFKDYLEAYLFTNSSAFNLVTSHFKLNQSIAQNISYKRDYFTDYHSHYRDNLNAQFTSQTNDFLFKTETFLLSIFEFLLSWRSDSSLSLLKTPGCITDPSILQSVSGIPLTYAEASFQPTSCHIFLVRCFIKYFYNSAFNGASVGSAQTPHEQLIHNKILSYQKCLANALCTRPPSESEASDLQHSLITQLKQLLVYCFQHWPVDLSFEVPVETWLTAIQPWRYAETPHPVAGSPSPASTRKNLNTDSLSATWSSFVKQQHDMYVILLFLFVQRAVRMDLHVCHNAHLVYRVAKVFSRPGLKEMLMAAEENVVNQRVPSKRAELPDVLSNVAQSGLWGPAVTTSISYLLKAMATAIDDVELKVCERTEPCSKQPGLFYRLFHSIREWVWDDCDQERSNFRRCAKYLRDATSMFHSFFTGTEPITNAVKPSILKSPAGRLQWDDDTAESPLLPVARLRRSVEPSSASRRVQFALDNSIVYEPATSSGDSSLPDSIVVDHGRQLLTPLGRYQILMGQRRPEIRYSGDRDFLPACTYEVPILVELFRFISGLINSRMRPRFLHWCAAPGWRGWIARRHLLPTQSLQDTSNVSSAQSANKDPHISLRWLANYAILARVALLYLLTFILLGLRSPLWFMLVLIAFYSLYRVVKLFCWLLEDLYNGIKVF